MTATSTGASEKATRAASVTASNAVGSYPSV